MVVAAVPLAPVLLHQCVTLVASLRSFKLANNIIDVARAHYRLLDSVLLGDNMENHHTLGDYCTLACQTGSIDCNTLACQDCNT